MFVVWIFPYILWNYDVLYLFLSFICCINVHTYGLYLVMTGVSLSPRSCVLVFKLYGYIFVVLFRYWSNSSEFLRTLMELFHFYSPPNSVQHFSNDFSSHAADNRTKQRRAERMMHNQDFSLFAERSENQRVHISPQLNLAAFQFLSSSKCYFYFYQHEIFNNIFCYINFYILWTI